MKKLVVFTVLNLILISVYAQNDSISKNDSVFVSNGIIELFKEIKQEMPIQGVFKMYPTENIYNLLRLNTQTGKISQVQWSLDSDKEHIREINITDFSYDYYKPGSFELYPTKNMYQFILLDKLLGRIWHVQWGLKSSERWIRRIYN